MKHYVLNDDIRNLLMQTILKEEDAKKYAEKLAAGDPNDPSEEGRGGDAKEYLKIRAEKEKEAKARKAKEDAKKPKTQKDLGQPTTDPEVMEIRRKKLKHAAEGAVGDDDPTDHMRGRVRNPHTDPEARARMKRTAARFAELESNARDNDFMSDTPEEKEVRAKDAERAARRNR